MLMCSAFFQSVFLDIKGLKLIITNLRARFCFELFCMGSAAKEDSATLLQTLTAWSVRSLAQAPVQSLAQAPVQ